MELRISFLLHGRTTSNGQEEEGTVTAGTDENRTEKKEKEEKVQHSVQ